MSVIGEYSENETLIIEPSDDKMKTVIAAGTEPDTGNPFRIIRHFNPDNKKLTPKISDNGSVNHHDLGALNLCKADDVLVSVIESDTADMGAGVSYMAAPDLSLMRGDNTVVSDDGKRLISSIAGMVLMRDGKVSVSGSIVINRDVCNTTGDIIFPGMVYVRGNVRDGYKVKADAGVRVGGVVEAAVLETDGDVVLDSGVRGANKAVIRAGGSIRANFLENCTVNARGDINADSILHSQVMCSGSLTLSGRHGALVGGKAVVRDGITADSLGSTVSTPTELYVGYEPDIIRLYNELSDEYAAVKKRYEEASRSANTLQARESLQDDKKIALLKLLKLKFILRDKLNELRKSFDTILPDMETSYNGVIKVNSVIHYGVKATIGNAVIYIRDELANCVLTNVNGKINIGIND